MPEPKKYDKLHYMARGILLGAGLGGLGGFLGLLDPMRGVFLGGLCGVVAGLTLHARRED